MDRSVEQKEIDKRFKEWKVVTGLVNGFFKDEEKAMLWFTTPNPHLGNVVPRDMIKNGRFKRLLDFVKTAIGENG